MNYSDKKKLAGRIVYIALAFMATVILCITLLMLLASKRGDNPDAPTGSNEPDVSQRTPDITTKAPDVVSDTPSTEKVDVKPDNPSTKPSLLDSKLPLPVNGTVSKSHSTENPVFSLTMNDYRVHIGLDIGCSAGDEVKACAAGKISKVYNDPFMGTCIAIDHGENIVSYYKNLAETVADGISEGASVEAGTVIGCVGETAIIEISDDAHLHFEITKDGKQIDPASVLSLKENQSYEG